MPASIPLPLLYFLQYAHWLSYAGFAMFIWLLFGQVPVLGAFPRWGGKVIVASLGVSMVADLCIFVLSGFQSTGALFNALINGIFLYISTSRRRMR